MGPSFPADGWRRHVTWVGRWRLPQTVRTDLEIFHLQRPSLHSPSASRTYTSFFSSSPFPSTSLPWDLSWLLFPTLIFYLCTEIVLTVYEPTVYVIVIQFFMGVTFVLQASLIRWKEMFSGTQAPFMFTHSTDHKKRASIWIKPVSTPLGWIWDMTFSLISSTI